MASVQPAPAYEAAEGDDSDARATEATRQLCAAAYLEPTFAQEVCDEVVEEPLRAVHVPVGIDIAPIARHCLAARRQKAVRDQLLLGVLVTTVLAVLLFADLTRAVVTGLLIVLLALLVIRGLPGAARSALAPWVVLAALVVGAPAVALLGALVAWAVVAWDLWSATNAVVRRHLVTSTFRPEDAPAVPDAQLAERLQELAERQQGNVTVYSGFSPFSGSGVDLGGWSFTVDVRRGQEGVGERLEPKPFEQEELYEAVTSAVQQLGIPGLVVEDRLVVSGSDLRHDRVLLPDPIGRPTHLVAADGLAAFVDQPTHRVRHYKCIRVVDWRGHFVFSLFLRFSMSSGRLFTEVSELLLTPLKEDFRRVDAIDPEVTARQVADIAGRSLRRMPALWLRSPLALLRPVLRARSRARALRRAKCNPFFDYGSPTTVLDRARSANYTRYFQMLDKEMYSKVLSRTSLDAIIEFLDRHEIDTTELAERRSTIVNNGIMVPGGVINAHNLAVGTGSRIFTRTRAAQRPAPAGQPGAAAQPQV